MAQAAGLAAGAAGKDQAEGRCGWRRPGSALRCSFCGKDTRQGVLLVASGLPGPADGKSGRALGSCDHCLELCAEILAETSSP